jgi:transposase-like protein
MQNTISRPSKMGAMVNRSKTTAKQYAVMILRDDYHYTFRAIGERMGVSESVAFRLYEKGINNAKTDKNLFELFWV